MMAFWRTLFFGLDHGMEEMGLLEYRACLTLLVSLLAFCFSPLLDILVSLVAFAGSSLVLD